MAIPRTDEGLREFSANLVSKCEANRAAWGIPEEDVARVRALHTDYEERLAAARSPDRRRRDTAAKNQSKAALTAGLTLFIGLRLEFNDAVTEPVRAGLGMPPKKKSWTAMARPDRSPAAWLEIVAARQVAVHFKAEGTLGHARPAGYGGAVIRFIVLDRDAPAPVSEDGLTMSVLATSTPHVFEFAAEERGKRVYFALAWQTRGAKVGPFSEILSELVP
jgi:hypothetical protein